MSSTRESSADSDTQRWLYTQYRTALRVNAAISVVEAAFGLIVLSWLVQSTYYHDSSLDAIGLLMLSWFYYGTIILPCCGIWLWVSFVRAPRKTRRYAPNLVLSGFYMGLLAVCVWITRLMVIDMWKEFL
mgnify:CR=1 FL=1